MFTVCGERYPFIVRCDRSKVRGKPLKGLFDNCYSSNVFQADWTIQTIPSSKWVRFCCIIIVMEQSLVLFHLILSTMPLQSYQMNYPTLQFGCVMEQPLSPLSYLFDLINYASLILYCITSSYISRMLSNLSI